MMNRFARPAIGASILVAALVLLPAQAAFAAGVEVSFDGSQFARTVPGALFEDLGHIVPHDEHTETFYVRNGGPQPGFLRVTLSEVTVSDPDFADALSVSASTPGYVGEGAVAVNDAQPCHVLVSGDLLQPGFVLPVTATLALDNLDGGTGMGATAQFAIRVTLTDTAPNLPATDCGGEGYDIPAFSPPTTGTGATGGTGNLNPGGSFPGVTNPTGPGADNGNGDGTDPDRVVDATRRTDPNTVRLFQELFVWAALIAFILGGGGYAFIAWRRRRDTEEAA